MREMKDSGIQWVGKVPPNWEIMPNKYLMHKVKKICPVYNGENILSLTMQGVIIRDFDLGGKMPATFDGYQIIYPGNLLMCLFDYDVTPRCIGLIKDKGLTSPAYSQFVMNQGADARYYYYYYLLLDFTKELLHLAKNLRHSFTEEQLGKIKVPVPPIGEQHRIADFLDAKCARIDFIRKNVEAEIEELKQYKQSVITEAVTKGLDKNVEMKDSGIPWIGKIPKNWKVCPLKYNFKIISGSTPDSNNSSFWDGNINWITPADFKTEDVYITKGSRTISEDGYKSCGTTMIPAGNIIFSKRAPIGSVVINKIALCTNQGCFGLIKETPEINTKYYYYILGVYPEVFNFLGTGTTFKEISAHTFSNVTLPFPPVQEQHRIADYLDAKCARIDSIIQKKQKLLTNLDTYKKSLIYEYVTGKKEVPAV